MSFDIESLQLDAPYTSAPFGKPLLLPIDSVDEDANQPRLEFDDEPLRELADSIRERGVKQPVSVRAHASEPNRWVLNFGARRLRACKLAGRQDIPAFVDASADTYDQVVENEQREGLKPLELALFMQRRLGAGDSQAEIARRLGKSRGYLTFVGALIDAPDWLMDVYRTGQCQSMTELYELRHLYEAKPDAVANWLRATEVVTRSNLQSFKATLQNSRPASDLEPQTSTAPALVVPSLPPNPTPPKPPTNASTKVDEQRPHGDCESAVVLWGLHEGANVRLDLSELPTKENHVFVLRGGHGERMSIAVDEVKLLRVTRLV